MTLEYEKHVMEIIEFSNLDMFVIAANSNKNDLRIVTNSIDDDIYSDK